MDERNSRLLVSSLLGVGVFWILLLTAGNYGVTWDEGFPQFPNALLQAEWFRSFSQLGNPFSRDVIDRYWDTVRDGGEGDIKEAYWRRGTEPEKRRSDHPSLPKTLMALSYLFFSGLVGTVRAFRMPSCFLFSLLCGVCCWWTAKHTRLGAGVFGALSLALMPRVFAHAHIASLDLPMMVIWFFSALAYQRAVRKGDWISAILFGLVYGLALSTKLQAFFILPGFLLWEAWEFSRTGFGSRKEAFSGFMGRHWRVWLCLVVLGPFVYLATQPYLWHDTLTRIHGRFMGYGGKPGIAILYLNRIYVGAVPWHYVLVFTLITVPVLTLILGVIGMGRSVLGKTDSTGRLLFACWLVSIGIFILPIASPYDGVRLILPSFVFLSVLAAHAYHGVLGWLEARFPDRLMGKLIEWGGLVLLLPGLIAIIRMHPLEMGFFNTLTGGVSGAQRMGLETTYWGDALQPAILERINREASEREILRVKPLAMDEDVLLFYRWNGNLSENVEVGGTDPRTVDMHLLQCRQGLHWNAGENRPVRPDYYLYEAYRQNPSVAKEAVVFDGIPFYILFGRLDEVFDNR